MGILKDFRQFRRIKSNYDLDKLTAKDFQRVFDGWFNVSAEDKNYVGAVFSAIDTHGLYYTKAKFRIYDTSKEDNIVEVKDKNINRLFLRPNEFQTWKEIAYKIATHFGIFGEAFIYKIRTGTKIIGYQLILPSLIKRKRKEESNNIFDHYEYSGSKKIERTEIIDLRYPNPYSDIEGYPIISSIADNVTVNQLQMEYSKKALEKGGYLGLTFATDQDMGKAQFDEMLKSLDVRYGKKENAFKVALLTSGLKPIAPPYSPKDMQFGENRAITRDEIFSAFKVPKILVGIGESINRATAEASIYQFTSGSIDPILSYVDEVLTLDFQKEFNPNYQVIHDTLAPKDVEGQLKYYSNGLKEGWLYINEVRKEEGMNKLDGVLADVATINVGGALVSVETGKQLAVENTQGVENGN